MTQEMVQRLVENYQATKDATAANKAAIEAFQQSGGSLTSLAFQQLLRERDEAYFQWDNALLSLQVLSPEEKLHIFSVTTF